MSEIKHRVAIVGCGNMGQIYADAYSTYPDTEIVAIAEHNPERLRAVGEKYGVKALYPDVQTLLKNVVPDIVAVITPSKYYKEAVIACAEAGVKGVSTDKPIAATLSDADEMVDVCRSRGVVYAGGNLQRAMNELQEAARRTRAGEYGELVGASVHAWGGEISGGGCQHISVLRLLAGAEVEEVVAWATHRDALAPNTDRDTALRLSREVLAKNDDEGLVINARFRLTSGVECLVFGTATPNSGVDVWSEDCLISWNWRSPEIYRGFDAGGARVRIDPAYAPYDWSEFGYLTGSIRSFLAAVDTGSELSISGHDLRQALEVAIAARLSAKLGSVPVKLPLEDRSLTLYPRPYRWLGGDDTDPARRDKTIWER
jgi:predicted dehydrogenase